MLNDEATEKLNRLTRLISFLGHDPDNESLLKDAMAIAIEVGDSASIETLCEHLITYPVSDSEVAAQATYLMLASRRYQWAADLGEQALRDGVSHPAVIFNTAYAHFYTDNFEAASALLSQLTEDVDCAAEALLLHARTLHYQDKLEEALALAERAHSQDEANAEIKGVLALLCYETDESARGLSLAHEALALDALQLDALIACASANFELGSVEPARKAWLHTVDAYPDCGRAWSGLAELEFSEMQLEEASEHLALAVRFMPDHIGTWHMLAWIQILKNDSAGARHSFEQAYSLDRNFGETHGGLAIADVMDGKTDEAAMGIRRALKLNPQGLSARFAEMLILQKAGKQKEAENLVATVLEGPAPTGSLSRKSLIEAWMRKHQQGTQTPPPGQH